MNPVTPTIQTALNLYPANIENALAKHPRSPFRQGGARNGRLSHA